HSQFSVKKVFLDRTELRIHRHSFSFWYAGSTLGGKKSQIFLDCFQFPLQIVKALTHHPENFPPFSLHLPAKNRVHYLRHSLVLMDLWPPGHQQSKFTGNRSCDENLIP